MVLSPRSTPCSLVKFRIEAEAYYEHVREKWPPGSIGCSACYMWMHPNSRNSHVTGKRRQKRIDALGVSTEDVLETRTGQLEDHTQDVLET